MSIASPIIIHLVMFGGFFLNSASIPVYFSWFKYANELLVINQWQNIDSIEFPAAAGNSSAHNTNCLYKSGEGVLKYLNFEKDRVCLDVGLLSAMLVGFQLIAFIILFIKARKFKQ